MAVDATVECGSDKSGDVTKYNETMKRAASAANAVCRRLRPGDMTGVRMVGKPYEVLFADFADTDWGRRGVGGDIVGSSSLEIETRFITGRD